MMYEDYFRNIVGGSYDSPEYYMTNYNLYPTYMNDYGEEYTQYENDMYNMNNDYNRFIPRQVNSMPYYNEYQENTKSIEVSNMYPEIYKKIEPILESTLAKVDITNLNKDMLDKITFEIYDKVEKEVSNNDVSMNTSVSATKAISQSSTLGTTRKSSMPTTSSINSKSITNKPINTNSKETKEVVTQARRRNNLLSDLIRILILNRIIGNKRPPFPGPRPPVRPGPNPRPPFPGNGRPPFFEPRPPFQAPRTSFIGDNQRDVSRVANAPISYFDMPYPEEQKN